MYTYMHDFPQFYYPYMHGFSPFYYSSSFAPTFFLGLLPFLLLAAIWTILIKGYTLWHAARNGQKKWFVALLVINTLGILEIIYLVWFRPNSSNTHQSHTTPAEGSSPKA